MKATTLLTATLTALLLSPVFAAAPATKAAVGVGTPVASSAAPDIVAAEAFAKAEKCMKCHDVAKDKKGPSFKTTAAKYKDKAKADETLMKFLATGPDDHAVIEMKDMKAHKAVENLILWIRGH